MDLGLVPVIRLTLVGNVTAIEPDKLKGAIDKYKEKKLLLSVLEALRTAALLKNQLGDLGFRGVSADIVLSVPPAFNVEFLKDPPPLTSQITAPPLEAGRRTRAEHAPSAGVEDDFPRRAVCDAAGLEERPPAGDLNLGLEARGA